MPRHLKPEVQTPIIVNKRYASSYKLKNGTVVTKEYNRPYKIVVRKPEVLKADIKRCLYAKQIESSELVKFITEIEKEFSQGVPLE